MTPIPEDRFGRKRADFAKVSLGAEDMVPWEYFKGSTRLVKELKEEGFKAIIVEQAKTSIDYRKVKLAEKSLVVLGNEVGGVSESLLKSADVIAEIPLKGKKESLNVSVAAGIALFRFIYP